MAETLRDFLVSIGFSVDTSSQQRVERSVSQSEAKLTQATVDALNKRKAAEDKALSDRINAVTAVGGELDAEEKAAAARFLKTQQDTADKVKKLEEEGQKKSRERREAGFKNAQAFILQFAALATKVAVAVEGAALGIVYATDKAAKSFEGLNYASQRIGAAPRSISAFAYAISQLGGSVEGANSSLETFGQKLKGPAGAGFEQMLQTLGVRTRDAAGNLRDSADIATDALQALGKRPTAESMAFANAFGFDDLTRRAGANPDLRGREDQFKADQARIGADPNAAAQAGTAFEQSMRHLEEVASSVATKIDTNLFKKIQPLLDTLAQWMVDHGGQIADIAERIANDLVSLANAMADAFAKVDWNKVLTETENAFKEFDKLTRKYFGEDGVTAVFVAFGAVLTANVIGKLAAITQALSVLGAMTPPAWLLAMLGISAVNMTSINSMSKKAESESAGPEANDLYLNDEGLLVKVPPGGGNMPDRPHLRGSFWQRTKQLFGFGDKFGSARAKLGRRAGMEAVPYSPDEFTKATGASADEYKAVRDGIADVEGSRYNQMGGSSGRFAGRYQMGSAEIEETAQSLGEAVPSQQQFLSDPQMQERFFERYTLRHYQQLMDNPNFKALSLRKRLEVLGYAHNQGVGSSRRGTGAMGYLDSGRSGTDAFGTSGTAYFGPIRNRLSKIDPDTQKPKIVVIPPIRAGAASKSNSSSNPFGSLDLNHFKTAPLGPTVSSMYQSYDNSRSRGDTTVNANQTFNISGGDVKQNMDAARLTAGRGTPDWIANLQGAEQ